MINQCSQACFDYGNEQNALMGKTSFTVKRIRAFRIGSSVEERKRNDELIMKHVPELTKRTIKKELFHSDKHEWLSTNNEFSMRLMGKKNVVIVIESHYGDIGGGYISSEIIPEEYVNDKHAFLFHIKKNKNEFVRKYPVKTSKIAFKLDNMKESSLNLFTFGLSPEFSTKEDLQVSFKDKRYGCHSGRNAYDYGKDQSYNPFFPAEFEIARIIAYEMDDTPDEKKKIMETRKKDDIEIPKRIAEMTKRTIKSEVFNSDKQKWGIKESEFSRIINGKKNVMIIIEDEHNNIFGGYVSKEIVINEWIIDQTAFVFSLKKDGKYHPKKYPLMEGGNGLFVFPEFRNGLFIFGGGNADDNSPKDISVVKKSDDCDRCFSIQQSFNYGKDKKALTGNDQFFVSRIIVYELN